MTRMPPIAHLINTHPHKLASVSRQVAKGRAFTPAAATFRPFVEQASGQLSLADFQALEREHQGLEELRGCGLTDEEIALKLEQEESQLFRLLAPVSCIS